MLFKHLVISSTNVMITRNDKNSHWLKIVMKYEYYRNNQIYIFLGINSKIFFTKPVYD